ncbi:MAG TPA: DNA polymerase III subunit beta [Coleofasciculaceae cyanobacterium]|jgi:DNA polymerase-3 subunit beta
MNTATEKRTRSTKTSSNGASQRTASKRRSSKAADPNLTAAPEIRQHIHLVCKQETLSEALAFVKAAVPNRTNQPVLTNALLAANEANQQITLTASDLTVTLTATLEAQVMSGGEISLPADILADVVSKCPTGILTLTTQISLLQAKDNSTVDHQAQLVDEENGVTDLRGMDANDFPPLASITGKQIELPAKVVKAGIQGTMFAICTDEEKRILTGLNWILNPTQQTLKCTATDGHQVAMIKLDLSGIERRRRQSKHADEDIQCTIPMKALRELTRTLEKIKLDTPLQFVSEGNRVSFEVTENGITKQLLCQCLEGEYPDCQALLNRYQYPKQVMLDKYDLLARLDRLAVLADKKEHAVRLRFDQATQVVTLSIEREYGKGQQMMPAILSADVDGMDLLFNVKYLLNVIKMLGSSALKLVLDQPHTPVNICSAGDVEVPELNLEATYFVMPLFDRERAAKTTAKEFNAEAAKDAEPDDEAKASD